MKVPENLNDLSLEDAKKLAIVWDSEIADLKEAFTNAKTMGEIVAAKDALTEKEAKKKELDVLVEQASAVLEVEETPEVPVEPEKEQEEVEKVEEEEEVVVPDTPEAIDATEIQTVVEPVAEEKEVVVTEEAPVEPEVIAERKPEVEVAASLDTGVKVDDIKDATEKVAPKMDIVASFETIVHGAKNEVEAIEKVRNLSHGGEAFKTVYSGSAVVDMDELNLTQRSDFVMGLEAPGREGEMTRHQKQWALAKSKNDKKFEGMRLEEVYAALCQPPTLLDSDTQCGSYDPVIFNSLPSFTMAGDTLELEVYNTVDSSDEDFVGEVLLYDDSGDPLDAPATKACYDVECLTKTQFPVKEVKACLGANEQTAFTSPRSVQGLLADGTALLAATRDQILIDWIAEQTYKFSYAAQNAGYAEIPLAATIAMEALNRQSSITQVEDLSAYIPYSMLSYAVSDYHLKQFSQGVGEARQAAYDLITSVGIRDVIVYDDTLDSGDQRAVPTLSKTSATALTARNDWDIHLVNRSEAFVGLRNENQYELEKVPQSITEKRANKEYWFARNYFTPGRRGCDGWATISFTNLCLGGRVVAAQTCLAES